MTKEYQLRTLTSRLDQWEQAVKTYERTHKPELASEKVMMRCLRAGGMKAAVELIGGDIPLKKGYAVKIPECHLSLLHPVHGRPYALQLTDIVTASRADGTLPPDVVSEYRSIKSDLQERYADLTACLKLAGPLVQACTPEKGGMTKATENINALTPYWRGAVILGLQVKAQRRVEDAKLPEITHPNRRSKQDHDSAH